MLIQRSPQDGIQWNSREKAQEAQKLLLLCAFCVSSRLFFFRCCSLCYGLFSKANTLNSAFGRATPAASLQHAAPKTALTAVGGCLRSMHEASCVVQSAFELLRGQPMRPVRVVKAVRGFAAVIWGVGVTQAEGVPEALQPNPNGSGCRSSSRSRRHALASPNEAAEIRRLT